MSTLCTKNDIIFCTLLDYNNEYVKEMTHNIYVVPL
jgi:hypothetical protein